MIFTLIRDEPKWFRQAQDGMPAPIAILQASRLPDQPLADGIVPPVTGIERIVTFSVFRNRHQPHLIENPRFP